MTEKELRLILKASANHGDVFFDCFDTLLGRKFGYDHAFCVFADYLIQNYGLHQELRSLSRGLKSFFNSVRTFEDACNLILEHYELPRDDSFSSTALRLMISAEISSTYPLPNASHCLDALKERKKTITVLTDFYLPRHAVNAILSHHFGSGTIDEVRSSCDEGKTKYSGEMYRSFCSSKNPIMIGDNFQSDYAVPKAVGIEAIQIESQKQVRLTYVKDRKWDTLESKLLRGMTCKKRSMYASNFSFMIFHFCKKLYARVKPGDILHFCAREGQFLKKAFDLYLSYHNEKQLKTEYLPVSRLALAFPTTKLERCKDREFFDLLCDSQKISLEYILLIVGFDDRQIEDFCQRFSLLRKTEIDYSTYAGWFEDSMFVETLQKTQDAAMTKIQSYLTSANNRFLLIDVGWAGSMQDRLRELLPREIIIQGYYMCLTSVKNINGINKKEGLISDLGSNYVASIFRTEMDCLESLLRADHGLLVCYKQDNDCYVDDAGLTVFADYSSPRQKIMLEAIRRLCSADAMRPISGQSLDCVETNVFVKWPISSLITDLCVFRGQLSVQWTALRTPLLLGYIKDAIARRFHFRRLRRK